ncbi:hypothetical protein M758_8G104500 [Ceratodon purpureus]|uniref:TF-B3 domain-containing protein n=1 Tax=Ceratodon purpureus TaxID=3225 RepID=A0A8T0H5M1_CERPU|nr:hypothetical protein KC19_8G108000 [Ceratodon purpureus]KAG0608413.1 hypothetical protein M758_8G104500 [Ceratodon purpureus]
MPNTKQTYTYVDDWRASWEPDLEAIAYNGATCDPTKVDPKVLDWVKRNCGDTPRFLKVINRNAVHDQPGLKARSSACMCVPGPFVKENYRNLQRVVTLEKNGEPEKKWKVSFMSTSNHPIWLQGWRRFAKDNNLKYGDVVVFELVGNSHFRFTAFDEDGNTGQNCNSSTRQNDSAPRVKGEPSYSSESQQQPTSATETDRRNTRVTRSRVILSDTESDAEADSPEARPWSPDRHRPAVELIIPKPEPVSLSAPATPQKRRRLCKTADMEKSTLGHMSDCDGSGVDSGQFQLHHHAASSSDSFNPLDFTISSKRRPVTAAERQRAKDLAEAHTHVTTSPHFLVVMSDVHVYQHFKMILPDQFVKESSLPATGCRITLEDRTGRKREVHSRENVNFQVGLIRKGWGLFALEHFLEEGDVCVFELSDREARHILVHIFRVVQIEEVDGYSFDDHYELHKKASRS